MDFWTFVTWRKKVTAMSKNNSEKGKFGRYEHGKPFGRYEHGKLFGRYEHSKPFFLMAFTRLKSG